jgi:vacuolar-type H+-ATPase subunit C/Vma6
MIDGRYTENGGTYPFMLYYFKRKNEIACVRTVLTGKANGLLSDEIKRRLITV